VHKLSELTEQELIAIQKLGIDANHFLLNNELYAKHIKPALEAQRDSAKSDSDWTPGKVTDTECIAVISVYNSGKRHGLRAIDTVCAGIVNRGVDAGRELERRRKNSAKKEDL
jgi:hypothetical protein